MTTTPSWPHAPTPSASTPSEFVDADVEAYKPVIDARRLSGDPDTGARDAAVRAAIAAAADMPLEIAEAGTETARLARRLAREGNPNLCGDALAALHMACGGLRTAAELARINLADADGDPRLDRLAELESESACRTPPGA